MYSFPQLLSYGTMNFSIKFQEKNSKVQPPPTIDCHRIAMPHIHFSPCHVTQTIWSKYIKSVAYTPGVWGLCCVQIENKSYFNLNRKSLAGDQSNKNILECTPLHSDLKTNQLLQLYFYLQACRFPRHSEMNLPRPLCRQKSDHVPTPERPICLVW